MTADRIFDAALSLLREGGASACGFQAVAERAGVARATLYRRWRNPEAMVLEALAARLQSDAPASDHGSLESDLRALMSGLAQFLQSPLGRAAIRAAVDDEGSDARQAFWRTRMELIAAAFARARQRGEIDEAADVEALTACLIGPLYFRLIVMAQPLDAAWIERVLRAAIPAPPRKA